MLLDLEDEDLTIRQQQIFSLHKQGIPLPEIAARTGLKYSSVRSAIHEIGVKQARSSRPSPTAKESIDHAGAIEERLSANGRCGRCELLEPHECLRLRADARRGEVAW